jgi:hypothetical protein
LSPKISQILLLLRAQVKADTLPPQNQGVRKLRCRKANPKNLIRIMPAEGWEVKAQGLSVTRHFPLVWFGQCLLLEPEP